MYRSAPSGDAGIHACRFKGNHASQFGGAIYEANVADGAIQVGGNHTLFWLANSPRRVRYALRFTSHRMHPDPPQAMHSRCTHDLKIIGQLCLLCNLCTHAEHTICLLHLLK